MSLLFQERIKNELESWMLVERKRLVNGIRFINFIDVCHGIDSRSFSYGYSGHVSLYLA